jgi:small subunit ribosomal protein S4e
MKRHLRRIAAPKTWPIPRKGSYWITRPLTTGIPFELCMPIILWLRDYLKIVENRREAKYILSKGSITINGKKIKDLNYPAGLFDTIGILYLEKYYRVSVSKNGKLKLIEIPKEEDGIKIIKIVRKNMVKGGKIQITGFDGRNFLTDDNTIKTGDSLLVNLKEGKIEKVIKMKPDNLIFFFKGSKVGSFGKLKEVKILRKSFGNTRFVVYEDFESKEIKETIADYGIMVGEEKPLIKI